jgi:hypothetical protein
MNSIHNPIIKIKLATGDVEIRELLWFDAKHLYGRLKVQIEALMNEKGALELRPSDIIAAINENIELGEWLVLKCTGKDEAWLNQRGLSEILALATEAAVLNIGILVDSIKNGGSRLREITAGANLIPNTNPSESTSNSPT